MRSRISLICLLSLGLLLLYLWTLRGSATVAVRVAGGRCVAEVYGRSSAIDCPGLAGGSLLAYNAEDGGADKTRGPLDLLERPSVWEALELRGPDGQTLPQSAPLPDAFTLSGRLRRPQEPGGLVLLAPAGDSGWVFILNGKTRSGEWWQWAGGKPTAPLAGIAVDMPFAIQARALVRQALNGWQGALILLGAVWLMRRISNAMRSNGRVSIESTSRLVVRWLTIRKSYTGRLPASRLPVVALILFAFAVALHVSVDVLERLPHVQDSLTHLFQAQTLAGGLTAPAPPLAGPDESPHFRQEFLLVRDGRWFGKYPPGYPALLAVGVAAGGHWLVNPLLAALTVALLFALAGALNRRDHGRQTTDHWRQMTGRRPTTADDPQRTTDNKRPTTDYGHQSEEYQRPTVEEVDAKAQRREGATGFPFAAQHPIELLNTDPPSTDHCPLTTTQYPLSTNSLNTDLLNTDLLDTGYWILPPLLLAVSPFFLIISGSLMAHAAELFWTTLFMVAWIKALGRGGWRWAAVAGLALGALFLTRQFTAVTIGLSFGLGWLTVARFRTTDHRRSVDSGQWAVGSTESSTQYPVNRLRQPIAPSPSHAGMLAPRSPRPPRSPAPLLLIAALAFAPFALALFAYQAAVTGDPLTDPRLLYWPYDRVGFGPEFGEPENVYTFWQSDAGPAIQWATDPAQPPRGHTPSRGLYNLGRNLDALEEQLFGWPALFTLAFIWPAFLLRRPAAADGVLLLVVLAIAAGYVTFWAAGIAYGPRYFYAALPALVILTARGASALGSVAGRRPVAVILTLLVAWNLLHLPARIESHRGYNFISAEPRAAVESAISPPALIFVTASAVDWWEYGAFFTGNTPRLDGDFVYARDLGAAENARLQAQFPGRAAYLWRDGRLTSIAPP
jgi:hypothetical protein